MILALIGLGAFCFTILGGLFALRFKDKLHLVLGFSAGAVVSVAFFDLLPEAISLASKNYTVSAVTSLIASGFIFFLLLDRLLISHTRNDECCDNEKHRGALGAGSLSIHSFLDGLIIGLSFQISTAVGAVVTVAVLTHNFSDGINTVGLILQSGGDKKRAGKWLLVDALAPVLGIFSTFFFSLKSSSLGIILALFCGFFLYIGASDLLPESHHRHPTFWTTFSTILGMAVLYIAIQLAGI